MPRASLESLLRAVCVPVTAEGQVGSGFFVTPDRIVTCAHVVMVGSKPCNSITARIEGTDRELVVVDGSLRRGRGLPDLILLKVVGRQSKRPYAALASAVDLSDELWVWGYPAGPYRKGDSGILRYQGMSRREDDVGLLKTMGLPLDPGFSGAPVLNLRTGVVCGMVRLGSQSPPVVRLVPAEVIVSNYAELRRYQQLPHRNRRWLDCLSDEQLRGAGISYPGPRMREYLAAVRATVETHPYGVPLQDAPPLTHVYLRQRGVTTTRSATSDRGIIFLPGPHRRGSSDSADSQELFVRHRNTLVMGRPGSGKSSLLRYVAGQACVGWLEEAAGKFVPAYLPATALTSSRPFASAVATAVSRELGSRIDESIPAHWFTEEPIPGIPWLLLVDGVDEILESRQRNAAIDAIVYRRFADTFRFLVASRPLGTADIKNLLASEAAAYEILPFSPDQLLILARTWFRDLQLPHADERAKEFRRSLEHSRIAHIACVPLIASMLCLVFAESPDGKIPENRAALYEEFIRVLLSKQYEQVNILHMLSGRVARYGFRAQSAVEELLEASRSLIERLAYEWYKGSKGHSVDLLAEWTARWQPTQMPASEWRKLLEEILRQSGVLVQRSGDFRFIHLTIQEYMATTHESRRSSAATADKLVFSQRQTDQSYRLFLAAICSRRSISFDDGAFRLLHRGTAADALFVAALNRDGVALSREVLDSLVIRLDRITAVGVSRAYSIDLCIQVAHELAFLSPLRGAEALARLASGRHVTAYDRMQAARKLVDLNFSDGMLVLRQQITDSSISGSERLLIAQYLLDLDPDIGIPALTDLARDSRINGWLRLDIVDELAEWDRAAATEALVYLVRDQRLEDFCRNEAYERLPASVAVQQRLKIVDSFSMSGRLAYSRREFDYERILSSGSKRSQNYLTQLAAAIADPDCDPGTKEWALRDYSGIQPDELVQWGQEAYCAACAQVYASLGRTGLRLDLPDGARRARRLAAKLDGHRALVNLVQLETLEYCDSGNKSCEYWLAVATILAGLSEELTRVGEYKNALSAINGALSIYRACVAAGLNLDSELSVARRLAADLRRQADSA